MSYRSFLLFVGLGVCLMMYATACEYDVRVVNGSKEPVPTAPMATTVPQADGTTAVNPQMGPPPAAPFGQRQPAPGVPWLSILLGAAGIAIPGLGITGALLAKVRAVKSALGVVVDAVEAAPTSAGQAVKTAVAAEQNPYLNAFVARRTE